VSWRCVGCCRLRSWPCGWWPHVDTWSGAALLAGATCTAAACDEDEEGAGSGLPPCQPVAEDPEGSFTSATAKGGGWDKMLATIFAFPAMCLTFDVSSARKGSCRWTLAVHGSDILCRAFVSDLWSVSMWNRRPSNRYLKWRTIRKAANSFLSKAEYFSCVESSFLLKKARGLQVDPHSCYRTAPT
jgi:hypothetical protein